MFVIVQVCVCLFVCLNAWVMLTMWVSGFFMDGVTGMGGGGRGVEWGGKRVGVMLVCRKSFQIGAKKGGWVLQMVEKIFSL